MEVRLHIGELYFLMPFLHALEYPENEPVCLLFTRERVYQQFRNDTLLTAAARDMGAVIVKCFADPVTGGYAVRLANCMSDRATIAGFPHTSAPALFNFEESRKQDPIQLDFASSKREIPLVTDMAALVAFIEGTKAIHT